MYYIIIIIIIINYLLFMYFRYLKEKPFLKELRDYYRILKD